MTGFESRLVLKKHVSTPEQVMSFHEYSKVSQGRFAVGGPQGVEVLSTGFGQTTEEAFAAAKAEVVSYLKPGEVFSLDNYTVVTRPTKVDDVVDLTKNDLVRGMVSLSRNRELSYQLTQVLGILANKNGFVGYISPSSVDKNFNILHRVKND